MAIYCDPAMVMQSLRPNKNCLFLGGRVATFSGMWDE